MTINALLYERYGRLFVRFTDVRYPTDYADNMVHLDSSEKHCKGDKRAHGALEMLVDDLHSEKEKTVNAFLSHSGSEDFLWGLVRLLGNDNSRVAGNAAYIIGTLAECDLGCMRILSLVKGGSRESKKILPDLTRMLTFDDSESVMNAAGTMGTLAESHEGREWILSEPCLIQTLEHITTLLHSENLWTASNAALVLARLSISEFGCTQLLQHEHSQHILSKLVLSLGVDEAGRGMNAAFAIGRLCDMDNGRKRLLQLSESERMMSSLAKMLSCDDTGASKNACFALSCLATNIEGHTRLLNNIHSEDILRTLSSLLNAEDSETGWFAAMTLRTLASQPKGCLKLRDHPQVVPCLKIIENKMDVNGDLKEEVLITLEILKRLSKPNPPAIEVVGANTIKASWDEVVTKSGFQVRYQLFDNTKCVYTGKVPECEVLGLQPNTHYTFKVRAYTEGDESPFSDTVSITTEESVPSPPQNVRILGSTITQLKVGWDPPEDINGVLKGYYVFLDDKQVEHTTENNVILTGLAINTTYEIQVCAATSRGRGEKAGVLGSTAEQGAHAPSKPHINVIGRNELHVSWNAPEVPLGRFNRYDVLMDDRIVYSGTDHYLNVRRLTPDTEYSFVVVALTSEGKFESKHAKKRTAKDEYDTTRPPLYQPPRKGSAELGGDKTPTVSTPAKTPTSVTPNLKKRKSLDSKRGSSAKVSAKRTGTGKERSKSSTGQQEVRPDSAGSSLMSSQVESEDKHEIYKQSVQPDMSPRLSLEKSPTPVPSVTDSDRGKPVAELKPEPRPVSKSRTLHPLNRQERTQPKQPPQPLALSQVSMQNSKTDEKSEEDSVKSSVTDSGGKKQLKSIDSSGQNGLKMERTKTNLTGVHNKKTKYSGGKDTQGTDKKAIDQKLALQREHTSSIPNKNMTKSVEESLKQELIISSSDSPKLSDNQNFSRDISKPHRGHSVSDKEKSRSHHTKHAKEKVLPKPSPPSQQYLEGAYTSLAGGPKHGEPVWSQKMPPSPLSSKDGGHLSDDLDWINTVKRMSEAFKGHHNPNLLPSNTDSTYYIDSSQFLQRTNTYINSHRPVGRKSLEKLQRSSGGGKTLMSVKVGQSMNFEPDIPDTSSKLANKFIPMQLRTQPSNLGIGQLQRVNTTLLGDISGDSVQFQRIQAITRSQTQIDMKQHHTSPTGLNSLGEDIHGMKQELGLSASPRKTDSQTRKARSGSAKKLSRGSLGSSQKEPDSVLLQQSWGLNPQETVLQNVR